MGGEEVNINIKFLIICYLISKIADWIFQSQWQADHKSKWNKQDDKLDSTDAAFTHSIIYSGVTTIGLLIFYGYFPTYIMVLCVLFFTHLFIDTRIPVKWIMRVKGLTKEQIADVQNTGFLQIGIDQRLHEFVILILALFI